MGHSFFGGPLKGHCRMRISSRAADNIAQISSMEYRLKKPTSRSDGNAGGATDPDAQGASLMRLMGVLWMYSSSDSSSNSSDGRLTTTRGGVLGRRPTGRLLWTCCVAWGTHSLTNSDPNMGARYFLIL